VTGFILALIHRWNLPQFLYNWQTLIAGVFALLAGFGTVWMTRHIANRQIAETREQTETTIRSERLRAAREGFAFHAIFDAAMSRVLADATDANTKFRGPGPNLEADAYFARTRFSKLAFDELRGACVSHGGRLTETFLELEIAIDRFASQIRTDPYPRGEPNGLPSQLDNIENKARHLREEAVAGMERARVVIAETEPGSAPAPLTAQTAGGVVVRRAGGGVGA
jgi:hypothetical protein